MAIVTATITVDFTAFYPGNHRVCYRIQGSGDPYDCSTIVNCVGGGTVCQAIFNADVNDTSCDGTVTFEGYVQAACEDVASLNGRDAFTVDFVPTVVCRRYEVTCENSVLENLTLTDGGSGYDPLLPPTVTINGDGAGATATAVVVDGVPTSILVLLGGSAGYTPGVYVDHPMVGGTGTGFTASFTVDGSGVIVGPITNNDDLAQDYTAADVLQPDPAGPAGTPTTPQDWTVNFVTDGVIQSLSLDTAGDGYTTGSVVIAPPLAGTTGTATIDVADCGTRDNVGPDCDGGEDVEIEGLAIGDMYAVCIAGPIINLTSQYSSVETGCCIPADTDTDVCFDYHIENTSGAPLDAMITYCGGDQDTVTIAAGATESVCAILDGVNNYGNADLVVTDTGSPCT